MTITGQSSLSSEEIDRMLRDAEAHAEEDRRRREEAEVRNTADSLVYQTERLLKDQSDASVEEALQALKDALREGDVEAIRSRTEALATASEQLGRRMYEQASSSPDDDEVVDAEIVDDERMSA